MTRPEEQARAIFGARAGFYTTSATHTEPQVLARVVELTAPVPDAVALDLATGTGHTAFAVAPRVAQVVGVDLTPEMLGEARRLRATNGHTNVTFCLADVHALPFADATFDIVTCRRAAHHFSAIGQALAEARRVLRPGGRLVVDDRSVPEDDFVDACMNELDRYHDASHVRQYRPSEWERLLAPHGFRLTALETYTRHRPLTSLTDGVDAESVARIHARLTGLNAGQRAALNLTLEDNEPYINHWYVMLAAVRL